MDGIGANRRCDVSWCLIVGLFWWSKWIGLLTEILFPLLMHEVVRVVV